MAASSSFLCGVIEGFYGRSWPHELRLAYAGYLADAGLDTCLYCPKGDPYLRRQWQSEWPRAQRQQMAELAAHYAARGVAWGVGLSPFELYRDYGPRQRRALLAKVDSLLELGAPLLAILFDDMPGDVADLAARQAQIVADVCARAGDTRVLVCPTYYSFDPQLERYFGAMPDAYWEQLGQRLPAGVDVFWTGNEVCSRHIEVEDIRRIVERLGRRVMLWDNYPVNDGAERSRYLYTRPLDGRDPAIAALLGGHLCNPMNQGLLSLPALAGLAALHGRSGFSGADLQRTLGAAVWQRLQRDGALFQDCGLDGLGARRCAQLAAEYAALPGAAAAEIAAWLRGEYRFDPACLTD